MYAVARDGEVVGEARLSCRDFALSHDGKHVAAGMQTKELPEADVAKFFDGTWGVALDDTVWEKTFVNVWTPVFRPGSTEIAVPVRLAPFEYSIARDETIWPKSYGCVWEPVFRPESGTVLVPVRIGGVWTLAEDAKEIWAGRYTQLWNVTTSADGKRIAACVSPDFGQWSIAVDDKVWPLRAKDCVRAPAFSGDGKRVAAAFRDEGAWGLAVDGAPWAERWDMVSDPVMSRDGRTVIVCAERGGEQRLVANGKALNGTWERLWTPALSNDGAKVLVRGIRDGKYVRNVMAWGG